MERRDALRVLGGGLAVMAGCGESGTVPESSTSGPPDTKAVGERTFSRFEDSGPSEATVRLARDDVPPSWRTGFHVAVFTRAYPRGAVVQSGHSQEVAGFEGPIRTLTVQLDEAAATADPVHRVAEIRPGPPSGSIDPDVGQIVAETDRFRFEADGFTRAPHPDSVGDVTQDEYSREAVEGAYHIRIADPEGEWAVPLRVFKSEFVLGRTGWRGHDYPPYVAQARETGLAGHLSREISRAAAVLDREPIRFAVAVVQALPYVPESVTESADEYIKYPAETLVDGGGDCEDSAILLASLVQAPPIERACALIHPPHHMGLGVTGDYSGTYYPYEGERYFYVETTGSGWEIGELPPEYADTTALVFEV